MQTTVEETPTPAIDRGGVPSTWAGLLEVYRIGPKQRWSGLLVERLGPWLTAARRQLHAVPPYLDQEDVTQQLILEVLQIASRWRPICEDRWIPRRLVERAARKLLKALLAEQLDQTVELDADLEGPERAEPDLVIETPIGRASVADLRVIYRANVLGEPIEALAGEVGITPKQIRRRLKSARARARMSSPTEGQRR